MLVLRRTEFWLCLFELSHVWIQVVFQFAVPILHLELDDRQEVTCDSSMPLLFM